MKILSILLVLLLNLYYYSPSYAQTRGSGTVKDIDGNVYNTVTIGAQTWLVENLRTTRYRNGEAITNAFYGYDWKELSTGAYCDYDYDSSKPDLYGRLYNWHAVNDTRGLAPAGWHVPTDAEWSTLVSYIVSFDGKNVDGGKQKESGLTKLPGAKNGTANKAGITAIPNGYRYTDGTYSSTSSSGYCWSSTEESTSIAWSRSMSYSSSFVKRYSTHKNSGFSVRCIRD